MTASGQKTTQNFMIPQQNIGPFEQARSSSREHELQIDSMRKPVNNFPAK